MNCEVERMDEDAVDALDLDDEDSGDALGESEEEDVDEEPIFVKLKPSSTRYYDVAPARHNLSSVLRTVCYTCGSSDHQAGACPHEI